MTELKSKSHTIGGHQQQTIETNCLIRSSKNEQRASLTSVMTTLTSNPLINSTNLGLPVFGQHRPRSGSAREHQIVQKYGIGGTAVLTRTPMNGNGGGGGRFIPNNNEHITSKTNQNHNFNVGDHIYRSNSSLEIIHDQQNESKSNSNLNNQHSNQNHSNLKREYGSQGSIDVISTATTPTTTESFFAMLQNYSPAVLGVIGIDQRSPGPAEFLKGKIIQNQLNHQNQHQHHHQNLDSNSTTTEIQYQQENNTNQSTQIGCIGERLNSPKFRTKLHRFWGPNLSSKSNNAGNSQSKCQPSMSLDGSSLNNSISFCHNQTTMISHSASMSSADIEERQRRRAFAHYDCQSLTANLGYAAKLRGLLLARRRNTTTGASAAAMFGTRSSTPDGDSGDEDFGDGQCNDLIESCPFFRNEIGNEDEREVSLTRMSNQMQSDHQRRAVHRPSIAYGISILECAPNEMLWKQNFCPFQRESNLIESIDSGARYYRNYFQGKEHQNWFGIDEQLGPVAISVKREKLSLDISNQNESQTQRYQFRLIVRTSELLTLRGSIIEDFIPNPRGSGKHVTTKEVIEYVAPEIQLSCLRLGVNTPQCEQQLMKLDEQGLTNKYKVGILYCRAGQSSEEDMYNNEDAGPAFLEFLETIGKCVRLKGFEHYKAGLDNKTDSTGTHSLYATYQDCEIMFHVSTMLPFTPNNRQQLLRKRHIGNDIVTIVFQEPGALPFTPRSIRSQFQHVFIIVRVVNPCTENTSYRIAVSRSKDVPVFGPPIPAGAIFPRNKTFTEFLLAKVINAENAAHRSEKFATMATRTRQEYLKDLANNYCTSTTVEPGTKFSIFPSKKKEKPKPRFSGDAIQRGAFCWQVVLQDSGLSTEVDCFLGISTETFVLIEECSRQIIFVTPTKAILGWSTNGNSLRVYHHQGECITMYMRDYGERDEQLEVIERLRAVTLGCGALELNLRRNPMGQLGFHVQPDGVVTQVEVSGQAWAAGLRQGYRLVEICKIAVTTLTHDQMVDLLKTSAQVTVTVLESFADHSPRRGCFFPNCKFNLINYENEYEIPEQLKVGKKINSSAQLQQPVLNHRRRYERNFSPPRSSNSSGYGTGSSSRSFSIPNEHTRHPADLNTLTSSSSGHSSTDDRWYDVAEQHQPTIVHQHGVHYHSRDHQKLITSCSLPIRNNQRPLSMHEVNKMSSSRSTNGNSKIVENEQTTKMLIFSVEGNGMESNSANNDPNFPTTTLRSTSSSNDEFSFKVPNAPASGLQQKFNKTTSSNLSLSSASSSRNNSPRPQSETHSTQSSPMIAKLRPASQRSQQLHPSQRNSVNYSASSSTLQEDLLKLISPEYMSSDDSFINANALSKGQRNITNSHSLGNISILSGGLKTSENSSEEVLLKKKSRSREAINLGQQPLPELSKRSFIEMKNGNGGGENFDENQDEENEVIFTTARPVNIIAPPSSSNISSSTDTLDDNVLHISENGTPHHRYKDDKRKTFETIQPLPLLPNNEDLNWSSLVDTATQAIMNLNGDDQQQQLSSSGSSGTLPELQTHLSQLEDRILRETQRRKSLENAVRRLTEENRRLQDESQAAVQQLRRFTEWFFQTIDRQS